MLESIRKGSRWLTWLFILTIGVVFVWFIGGGTGARQGAPTGGNVVQVGDISLGVADFQRARAAAEPRIREQLGGNVDSKMLRQILDTQTMRTLVDTAILADAANDLGLYVSKAEIQELVASSPGFRDETGKFDRERFDEYARYEFGSQANFIETIRNDLLRQKLVQLISDQASVSDGEARFSALHRLEGVRIAYVSLQTDRLAAGDELEEAEVAEYLDTHQDEIQVAYEERKAEYDQPERVTARHIALRILPESSDEDIAAVEARAQEVLGRLEAGEDFATLAAEVSDDLLTKNEGGSLGTFPRGEVNPALEEAAFALEAGERSGVVRSETAFHVIEVEEKLPAGLRTYDDVKLELAREKATERIARERADALTQELAEAVQGGASLEDAARERELTLERTDLLRRRADGFVPKLGASQELLTEAFALDMEAPSSDRIFEVGPRLVMIQLLERAQPEAGELDIEMITERVRLLNAKRNRLVQEWIDNHRASLEESGELLIDSSQVIRTS